MILFLFAGKAFLNLLGLDVKSFAVGGSPNPSQAIGVPAVGVAQPVPEAQQPVRAEPATSRTMNLVSIVAPVWPPLKPMT